jgi:hypothetical protein
MRWQMENILRDPAIKISILGKDGALLEETSSSH